MTIIKATLRAVAGFAFGAFFGVGIAMILPFAWAAEAARWSGEDAE